MILEQFKNIEEEIVLIEQIPHINVESKTEIEKNLKNFLVKYEKFLKPLLNEYFKDKTIEEIARTMIENIILVKLLKEQNISLSKNQKENNDKFIEIIKKILEMLKTQVILIKQIKDLEIYIDSNVIEKLKIEESIENLNEIILYNKKVFDKKNGVYITEETIEKKEHTEIQEPTKTQQTKKKKKRKQKPTFVMLIFENVEEIQNTVKEEFNITIPNDLYGNNFYEMGAMINLLRMKAFKGIKNETELIENILRYSNIDIIKDIANTLEETIFTANDLLEIKSVFFSEKCNNIDGNYEEMIGFIKIINYCPYLKTKEEKIKLLKMNNKRIKTATSNILILLAYQIRKFDNINLLTRRISIEYLDQIVECGMIDVFRINGDIYFEQYRMPQIDDVRSEYLDELLFSSFYQMKHENINAKEFDEIINEITAKLTDTIQKNCIVGCNNSHQIIRSMFSKSKILIEQKEISRAAQNRILDVLIPKFIQENKYTTYLDENYINNDGLAYKIPVDKNLSKCGYILISRNKVLRLLNEHALQGTVISPELIKSTMLYNLIITNDILEELEKSINNIFLEIDNQKKINKSIK